DCAFLAWMLLCTLHPPCATETPLPGNPAGGLSPAGCWTPTQDCALRCDGASRCIPESWLCDGHADCLDRTDEQGCGETPGLGRAGDGPPGAPSACAAGPRAGLAHCSGP
uniref:Uncharacterized protein n=1 Tax=Dromaius novaehollandiae TaxID=8790 RepID=A0A8C4PBR8_DRONO